MRFTQLKIDDLSNPDRIAKQIEDAVRSSTVVQLIAPRVREDALGFWERVMAMVGEPQMSGEDSETGFDQDVKQFWMDVRYDPKFETSFRHSKTAQPLHTDGAYHTKLQDVIIFYCQQNAPRGGATTFVDGEDLVEFLEKRRPDLLRQLMTTEVDFSKLGQPGKKRPIIIAGENGIDLNWNYYRFARHQDPAVVAMCEEFHEFMQTQVVGSPIVLEIILQEGETLLFRDHKVFHGRNSFEASKAGDRWIWKGNVDLREV